MIKSNLPNLNLNNQRVFLRADLNIPIKNGIILDDFKLIQILPTIDLIQKKGGKIILATHINRPKNFDPNLSTKNLITWFENKNYKIDFESDLNQAVKKSFDNKNTILLLENLRFFPEEKTEDNLFSQSLSKLADLYVNDAFGTLHRNDNSISILPKLFDKDKKTIGLLVENEILNLEKIINSKDQPFLLILGGGKIKDKINLLKNLLNKINLAALCPAIVFTFLKAKNKEVGKSLIDENLLDFVNQIELEAKEKNINFIFPQDYLVAQNSIVGSLKTTEKVSENEIGISIGPKTSDQICNYIKSSKIILFNGLPGFLEKDETLKYVIPIFKSMAETNAYTIVAGGDSVAAVRKFGFANQIKYLSTGGGAFLAYLSKQELPGLKALEN